MNLIWGFLLTISSPQVTIAENKCSDLLLDMSWVLKNDSRPMRLESPRIFEREDKLRLSQARSWAHQKTKTTGRLKFKPVVPDAPEESFYNWAPYAWQAENIQTGFSRKQVKELLEHKHINQLGFYVSHDPFYSSYYGDTVMEVVVYKDYFPVEVDGAIRWKKINDSYMSVDITMGSDWARQYSFLGVAPKDYRCIYDLRLIKELRWPRKEMILSLWRDLRVSALRTRLDDSYDGILRLKILWQWLLTPNYSLSERIEIANLDREKFAYWFNYREDGNFIPPRDPGENLNTEALFMNNALEILLGHSGDFIDAITGVVDYFAIDQAYLSLGKEARVRLSDYMKFFNDHTYIKKVINLVLNKTRQNRSIFEAELDSLMQREIAEIERLNGLLADLRAEDDPIFKREYTWSRRAHERQLKNLRQFAR